MCCRPPFSNLSLLSSQHTGLSPSHAQAGGFDMALDTDGGEGSFSGVQTYLSGLASAVTSFPRRYPAQPVKDGERFLLTRCGLIITTPFSTWQASSWGTLPKGHLLVKAFQKLPRTLVLPAVSVPSSCSHPVPMEERGAQLHWWERGDRHSRNVPSDIQGRVWPSMS